MDLLLLQGIAAVAGVVIGVLLGVIGLATAWVNFRKAQYEALKAGVSKRQPRMWLWLKSLYGRCIRSLRRPAVPQLSIVKKHEDEFHKLFAEAPGLKLRKRRDGTTAAYWQARHDASKGGYRPTFLALWRGEKPTEEDKAMVSRFCIELQQEMIEWLEERRAMTAS
jgi:hypothetical protein